MTFMKIDDTSVHTTAPLGKSMNHSSHTSRTQQHGREFSRRTSSPTSFPIVQTLLILLATFILGTCVPASMSETYMDSSLTTTRAAIGTSYNGLGSFSFSFMPAVQAAPVGVDVVTAAPILDKETTQSVRLLKRDDSTVTPAPPVPIPGDPISLLPSFEETSNYVNAHRFTIGIILILVGLTYCFCGFRLFNFTLFVTGFLLATVAGYILLYHLEPVVAGPGQTYGYRDTVYLLGSVSIGLLGGLLTSCIWPLGVFAVGAVGGVVAALYVLAWTTSFDAIQSGPGRAIFILLMAIVGIIAVRYAQRYVLIVATALAGAFAVAFGFDMFMRTDFVIVVDTILTGTTVPPVIAGSSTWILLALIPLLTGFGIAVQLHFTHPSLNYRFEKPY